MTMWSESSEHPRLDGRAVHVWLASVVAHAPAEPVLRTFLSPAELGRADGFRFAEHRTRYVVAHGVLRLLLGRYLGEEPARLGLVAGAYGKPRVEGWSGRAPIEFNLSHSVDVVLVAVTRGRAVGVDVERWIEGMEHLELARRFFSPAERTALSALPPDARVAGFFAAWSRKEAYVKATGFGLSRGLDHFDVSLELGTARLLEDRLDPDGGAGWTMRDLALGPGYSGAVAARGGDWRLETFRLGAEPGRDAPGAAAVQGHGGEGFPPACACAPACDPFPGTPAMPRK